MKKSETDQIAFNSEQILQNDCSKNVIKKSFRVYFAIIIMLILLFLLINPYTLGIFTLYLCTLNFFILILYRFIFVFINKDESIKETEVPNFNLPSYTILVPLKNESAIVSRTVKCISEIDYPKELLEVIIIVEEGDYLTKKVLGELKIPNHFLILEIPVKPPFTKGRAIQYGLNLAKGYLLTVYDAEDRPDKLQLKKAALKILSSNSDVCYQSMVRLENSEYNLITRFYAAEFFEWFEVYLKKLSDFKLSPGLAGQSFHIKTDLIKSIGGWDPYNVTEDADLSVRLIKNKVELKILESFTWEFAPIKISTWIKQRIRWCKGLLITQLVYLRYPFKTMREMGLVNFVLFWLRLFCGTMVSISSIFIITFFLLHTLNIQPYNTTTTNSYIKTCSILLIIQFILSFCIAIYNAYSIFKLRKISINFYELIFGVFFYWILYTYASLLALFEYIISPTKWNVTEKRLFDHSEVEKNRMN